MSLPQEFTFSQSSLQDYLDCPRRFQLRYLLKVSWPALQSEPVQEHERQMQQGQRFHRLVQQYFLGLPLELLSGQVKDNELALWWQSFLASVPDLLGISGETLPDARLLPESYLVMPFAGTRLAAKLDLLVDLTPEKVLILDWKTGRKRQRRDLLAEKVQTRLYPFLLAHAGAHLRQGSALQPEQIEMVYWYAGFPQQPERFTYDSSQLESDRADLSAWVNEIAGLEMEKFPLTAQVQRCKFCVYRSLCERGTQAGDFLEAEDEFEPEAPELALDFEQIAEIEF